MSTSPDDLPESARTLLAAGRPPRAMTVVERAAMLSRAHNLAAAPAGFVVFGSTLAKALAATALVGVTTAVLVARAPRPSDTPRARHGAASAPLDVPSPPPRAEAPPAPPPPPTAPAPPRPARPVVRARPVSRENAPPTEAPARPVIVAPIAIPEASLARERELIGLAQRAMEDDPDAAAGALEAHAREAPRGALAAEREYLSVRLLCARDHCDEARGHVDELARIAPRSVYVERARRIINRPPIP